MQHTLTPTDNAILSYLLSRAIDRDAHLSSIFANVQGFDRHIMDSLEHLVFIEYVSATERRNLPSTFRITRRGSDAYYA